MAQARRSGSDAPLRQVADAARTNWGLIATAQPNSAPPRLRRAAALWALGSGLGVGTSVADPLGLPAQA